MIVRMNDKEKPIDVRLEGHCRRRRMLQEERFLETKRNYYSNEERHWTRRTANETDQNENRTTKQDDSCESIKSTNKQEVKHNKVKNNKIKFTLERKRQDLIHSTSELETNIEDKSTKPKHNNDEEHLRDEKDGDDSDRSGILDNFTLTVLAKQLVMNYEKLQQHLTARGCFLLETLYQSELTHLVQKMELQSRVFPLPVVEWLSSFLSRLLGDDGLASANDEMGFGERKSPFNKVVQNSDGKVKEDAREEWMEFNQHNLSDVSIKSEVGMTSMKEEQKLTFLVERISEMISLCEGRNNEVKFLNQSHTNSLRSEGRNRSSSSKNCQENRISSKSKIVNSSISEQPNNQPLDGVNKFGEMVAEMADMCGKEFNSKHFPNEMKNEIQYPKDRLQQDLPRESSSSSDSSRSLITLHGDIPTTNILQQECEEKKDTNKIVTELLSNSENLHSNDNQETTKEDNNHKQENISQERTRRKLEISLQYPLPAASTNTTICQTQPLKKQPLERSNELEEIINQIEVEEMKQEISVICDKEFNSRHYVNDWDMSKIKLNKTQSSSKQLSQFTRKDREEINEIDNNQLLGNTSNNLHRFHKQVTREDNKQEQPYQNQTRKDLKSDTMDSISSEHTSEQKNSVPSEGRNRSSSSEICQENHLPSKSKTLNSLITQRAKNRPLDDVNKLGEIIKEIADMCDKEFNSKHFVNEMKTQQKTNTIQSSSKDHPQQDLPREYSLSWDSPQTLPGDLLKTESVQKSDDDLMMTNLANNEHLTFTSTAIKDKHFTSYQYEYPACHNSPSEGFRPLRLEPFNHTLKQDYNCSILGGFPSITSQCDRGFLEDVEDIQETPGVQYKISSRYSLRKKSNSSTFLNRILRIRSHIFRKKDTKTVKRKRHCNEGVQLK